MGDLGREPNDSMSYLASRPSLAWGARGASGLSDLILRRRLKSRCEPPGRTCIAELPNTLGKRVVGAPMVSRDQRTPVEPGRPRRRITNSWDAIDALIHQLGSAESPHHPRPQAAHGSLSCQRAPTRCVLGPYRAPGDHRATLTARRASGGTLGRGLRTVTSSWALRSESALTTRLEAALRARGAQAVQAAHSTLGTARRMTGLRPRLGCAGCHASAPRRRPRRSA